MNSRSVPKFNSTQERENFWLGICQKFISSGLSKVSFCKSKGISEAALYRWMQRYKKELTTQAKPSQAVEAKALSKPFFVPIKPGENEEVFSASSMQILLPNGVKIITNQLLNEKLLSELIRIEV
jgi:hypothetical protein